MSTYNLSGYMNASSPVDFVVATNETLGGYFFGIFLLLIISVVIFLTLKTKYYSNGACFAASMWSCMIASLFLMPLGLLSAYFFWAVVLLTAISSFALFMEGNAD